ncbi:hypothetical protein [Nocardiopsis synnemataformans]
MRSAVAPVYHRLFVSREPVTPADLDLAARIAAGAAARAAFVRAS